MKTGTAFLYHDMFYYEDETLTSYSSLALEHMIKIS